MLLKLFDSCVKPILLYACEIWGTSCLGRIAKFDVFKSKMFKTMILAEKLHIRFCKRVLGVHSKATNLAVYAELGRVPLLVQISNLIIKYWLRLKDTSYQNTLVGEARKLSEKMNSEHVTFINFLFQLCGHRGLINKKISLNQVSSTAKATQIKTNLKF